MPHNEIPRRRQRPRSLSEANAYIRKLEIAVVCLFLLGGFTFPALRSQLNELRCVKETHSDKIINGVGWPIISTMTYITNFNGMGMKNRCLYSNGSHTLFFERTIEEID